MEPNTSTETPNSEAPWCSECRMNTTHRCSVCGDPLVRNYEFDDGRCYRCQEAPDAS